MAQKIISTISGQVYELLKQDICEGKYAPGQWLQEKELAEQFSVSRSPVREALKQLSDDGLVVNVPNKGVFVRKFTEKDILEIYDLRVMMESYAIQKITELMNENIKTQLAACLERLEEAYRKKDHSLYTKEDMKLHDQIIKLSGNDLLALTYERVHMMIHQFRAYSLMDQTRFDESIAEHRSLVNYILAGKAQLAIETNRKHLLLAAERVNTNLKKAYPSG
ncbi:MAG: GntR family transcriptional regulator [Lachnospiraceae bacterium]|nr:GntR family transcriptional regulator [Lachnospiraceae bacterium]